MIDIEKRGTAGVVEETGEARIHPKRLLHEAKRRVNKEARRPRKVSRLRKPADLSLSEWQIALRREYGRAAKFRMKNLGDEPVFSNFQVTNPESGGRYRVAINGANPGDNFCECLDFAVNTLGTCKHVEFVLAKLGRTRTGRVALARGRSAGGRHVKLFRVAVELFGIFELVPRLCSAKRRNAPLFFQA
jgi:hypothetical protein